MPKYQKIPNEYKPAKMYSPKKLQTMKTNVESMISDQEKNHKIGYKTVVALARRRIDEINSVLNKKSIDSVKEDAQPMKPKTKLQHEILDDVEEFQKYLEILSKIDAIQKQSKVYLKPGETAPEGSEILNGPKGAKYYIDHGVSAGPKMNGLQAKQQQGNFNSQENQEEQNQAQLQQPMSGGNPLNSEGQGSDGQGQENIFGGKPPEDDRTEDEIYEEEHVVNPKPNSKDLMQRKGWVKLSKTIDQLEQKYNDILLKNKDTSLDSYGALHNGSSTLTKSVDSNINNVINSTDIFNFLVLYKQLSVLGLEYPERKVDALYNLSNRIMKSEPKEMNSFEKVIYIDSVAHKLHQDSHEFKKQYGIPKYKILDEIANMAKSLGEESRENRLLILNNLDKEYKIMYKSLDNGKSYWKLMESAIKDGIENLNDDDIITLREWIYSKI
jgi:hypothetical protein